jgi:hypothetical protein
VSRTIAPHLKEAWEASEATLEQLLEKCRRIDAVTFDFDVTSLSRKLSGKQTLRDPEIAVLMRVLDVSWPSRSGQRAS